MHRTARSKGGKAKMPKSFWLGLSVVGVLFCAMMLWHRNKSVRVMYVLIFFVMDVVFCFAFGVSLACYLAFFLLNISAIMAFTSSPTCTKFL